MELCGFKLLRTWRAVVVLCLGMTSPGEAQTPPLFNVKDYGAAGDGAALDSPAINQAIAAANAAGGGTVTFPPGNYLCGSIHLTNNVTLYLSNSAVIQATSNHIDPEEPSLWTAYQDVGHTYFHDALIRGENLTNIGITGPGTIDGITNLVSGNPAYAGQGDKAISLKLCTNVTIAGVTITRAGHFGLLVNGCDTLRVSGIQILNDTLPNHRDAFNLISSSDVVITNCVIQGSDDAMCLKSDYALGQKINSHNIHIRSCRILSTQNNATQFGSETVGDFSDVSFANLQISGAGKAGIGITSQDGSIIDGVTYDGITLSNCACPIWLKLDKRTTDAPGPPPVGRIRNISINNVVATHSTLFNRTNTSTIDGYFDGTNTIIPIENITLNNVDVSNLGGNPASAVTNVPVLSNDWQPQNFGKWPAYGWYLRYARNISFTNCQVHFDANDNRATVAVDTVTNVLFDTLTADVGASSPYDLRFTNTLNFEVINSVSTGSVPLRLFISNATPASIVSPPYFSPGDGTYAGAQSVVLTSGTTGATIRYTTDGSTPGSSNGNVYSGPVPVSSESVLRAMASAGGMVDSAVNTAIYSIVAPSVAIPTFSPAAGTYATAQSVTLNCVTAGASIRYTTDGSPPSSTNGALYSVPVPVSSNVTLMAYAFATNQLDSPVAAAAYVVTGQAATPDFSPPGGTYTNAQLVTITSVTRDAAIRYTIDGTPPTSTAGTLYSVPVVISSNTVLMAMSFASGATDSAVASAGYSIVPPPPVFAFEAETLAYVTNGAVAVLQNDTSTSGGHWLALTATGVGQYIEYTIPDIPAGTYDLQISYKGNTQRGILSCMLDGAVLGNNLDQYSANQTYPTQDYGNVTFSTNGNHRVRLTVVGKNPSATGYWLSVDRFVLTLVQAPAVVITREADGSVQLVGAGAPGVQYAVQANADVSTTNWTDIGIATAAMNGTLLFTDSGATNYARRFYRFNLP